MTLVSSSILPVQASHSTCLSVGEPQLLHKCLKRLHGLTEDHLFEEVAVQSLKVTLLGTQDEAMTCRYCKQVNQLTGWLQFSSAFIDLVAG